MKSRLLCARFAPCGLLALPSVTLMLNLSMRSPFSFSAGFRAEIVHYVLFDKPIDRTPNISSA
jgi:hypothetical protein